MSKRIFYCGVVVLSLFLLLTGRLGYLVLARGDSLAVRGAEQQLRSIDLYQYNRGRCV